MSTNPTRSELDLLYASTRELEKLTLQSKKIALEMENKIAELRDTHNVPASIPLDLEKGVWVKIVGKNQDGSPAVENFVK